LEEAMSTAVSMITPEELLQMGDEGKGYELVNGELKELDVSARSSRIGGQFYRQLENYSRSHTPCWVFPPETGFRCFATNPSQVRKPDTSFIALDRLSRQEYEEDGFIEVVPDLVAEVISPNDNAEDLGIKIDEWLRAGVKVVWEVYPATLTVRSHLPGNIITLFRATDTLTSPEVLPGFACLVADLFRLPGEPVPSA
jgi:Uma2 family endonuclease